MNFSVQKRKLQILFDKGKMEKIQILKFDKRRLQQVLLNLLSNACKYQVSGIIEVEVKCIQAYETLTDSQIYLKISVNDEGVGMSVEKVKGIFEPFG